MEVDALDVAANAAFAKRESHPRFEMMDDAGLHFRVLGEVEVEAVGKSAGELLQPRRTGGVLQLERGRINKELHAEVLIDLRRAFGFSRDARAH